MCAKFGGRTPGEHLGLHAIVFCFRLFFFSASSRMPVPNHSTMISKRIKQLKSSETNTPKHIQLQQTKPSLIRVICTDPDATDSSSDEEDSASESHVFLHHHQDKNFHRKKRLIREIALPKSSKSPNQPPQIDVSAQSVKLRSNQRQEELKTDLHDSLTVNTNTITSYSNRIKEHAVFHDTPKHTLQQEKDASDLVSFVDGLEERNTVGIWDHQFEHSDNQCFEDIMDLELDPEALSWINSLQKIV